MSTQEHTNTYSRADINHAYSTGFSEGSDYARAEVIAFLALGGTFRGLGDDIGIWARLRFAWCALRSPASTLRSANMRAAHYLQMGE